LAFVNANLFGIISTDLIAKIYQDLYKYIIADTHVLISHPSDSLKMGAHFTPVFAPYPKRNIAKIVFIGACVNESQHRSSRPHAHYQDYVWSWVGHIKSKLQGS
jgi:hypothetical protein